MLCSVYSHRGPVSYNFLQMLFTLGFYVIMGDYRTGLPQNTEALTLHLGPYSKRGNY